MATSRGPVPTPSLMFPDSLPRGPAHQDGASEREEAGGVLGPGRGQSGERPEVRAQLSPEQEGREGPVPRSLCGWPGCGRLCLC